MAHIRDDFLDDEGLTEDLDDGDAQELLLWATEVFENVSKSDQERFKKTKRIIRRIAKVSAYPMLYDEERLARIRQKVLGDIQFVLGEGVDLEALANSFKPLQNLTHSIRNIKLEN